MSIEEIQLIDTVDTEFTHQGVTYYMILTQREIKKEIADDKGMIETEVIDHDIIIGSPYKAHRRFATTDDVTTHDLLNYIISHKDDWRKLTY